MVTTFPPRGPDQNHQGEMRAPQPLSASQSGNQLDEASATHDHDKASVVMVIDRASRGRLFNYVHDAGMWRHDGEMMVDDSDAQGTADDPIVISPTIAPVSLPTPTSSVIHTIQAPNRIPAKTLPSMYPFTTPATLLTQTSPIIQTINGPAQTLAKVSRRAFKRTRSPGAPGPDTLPSSSKKVRFNHEQNKSPSFRANDQTFTPRAQCMHQRQAVMSQQARPMRGLDIQAQSHCVQSFCEGFDCVDAGVRCALIVSIDCVGFKVPFAVLKKASPLLFTASDRHGGVLHVPEPREVIKFLLDCMTQKQVQITVGLADLVAQDDNISTFFGVLVRLYNIAEEFGIDRAMRMIRNLLPSHAASNPRVALGFALRDSPIDRQLAYHALSHFDPVIAKASDLVYWTAIGWARLDSVGFSAQHAVSWAETLHITFMVTLEAIAEQGCKPTDAGYWERVALHFLRAIDDNSTGDDAEQRRIQA